MRVPSSSALMNLSIWLYVSVGGLAASVVLYYRLDDGVSSRWVFTNETAWLFAAALATSVLAVTMLVARVRRAGGIASKPVRLSLTMSFVSIAFMLLLCEAVVRAFAVSNPEGSLVGDVRLLPRDWQEVAAYRGTLWQRHASDSGVFVFDAQLGWTVAPNGQGMGPAHETYFSSAEGLRAPAQGIKFGDRSARTRIALLGDSYVFGSDVVYEDTWGFQLQQRLGPDTQVLNFGVPGYGVDQAYLRYLKDVRPWHPDIAILGLISHDLLRTTMIYYAVGFPGAVVPGAKPRFILRDRHPVLLNVPLPRAEDVYAARSIRDLPFIDYDRMYRPTEWQRRWYEFSYLLRLAISWSPQSGVGRSPPENEETASLNGAIIRSFVRDATDAGTIPIVAFLPSFMEFRATSGRLSGTLLLGMRVLEQSGVEFVDLTSCVEKVDERERFTAGWHYTPRANSAVGDCLRDIVEERLSGKRIPSTSQ